jgi:hypothetical protein
LLALNKDHVNKNASAASATHPYIPVAAKPTAQKPLTGGCLGKGQSHCVDPGANVEEQFQHQSPDLQKPTDANPKQQRLPCSHQRTAKTKINRQNLQNAGLHFL